MTKRLKVSPLTFGRMVGALAAVYEVVPELMQADMMEESTVRIPVGPLAGTAAPALFSSREVPIEPRLAYREFRRVNGRFLDLPFKFYEELP